MMVMDELNADIARLKQSLAEAREQLNRSPQTTAPIVFMPDIAAGSSLVTGLCASAALAKATSVAARVRIRGVLMRHAPPGTCPSPCDKGDGSDRPNARARRQ